MTLSREAKADLLAEIEADVDKAIADLRRLDGDRRGIEQSLADVRTWIKQLQAEHRAISKGTAEPVRM